MIVIKDLFGWKQLLFGYLQVDNKIMFTYFNFHVQVAKSLTFYLKIDIRAV